MHKFLLATLLALLAGCGKSTGVGGTAGDAMPAVCQSLGALVWGRPESG